MLPVQLTLSKMTTQRWSVWPGCVKKLKFVSSPPGKFRMVQLRSTLIWDGGIVPGTKPSRVPFGRAEQSTALAADAAPSSSTQASSQFASRLPLLVALFAPIEVICALVPLSPCASRARRDRGSPCCGLDSGGPAVLG